MPDWPFIDQHSGFLILECPKCMNRLRFEAIFNLNGNLIWSCVDCGNNESLDLRNLLNFTELGFNFPEGCQNFDHQRKVICIPGN